MAAVALWLGATLVLQAWGPVRRPGLVDRLRPHLLGTARVGDADRGRGWSAVAAALRPLTDGHPSGRRTLAARLARTHHPLDPGAFRARQAGHGVLALGVAGVALAASPVPVGPAAAVLLVLGAPVAVVAGHEQALARRDRALTRRLARELPVVAEQLAMLLGAGRSVAVAVAELAARGRGPAANDLGRVAGRIRHGLDEATALREWADLRRLPGVTRLVAVLTLAHDTADLDRLVDQEADALRAEAHRDLLATLERRAQQVWVPVTVATLLPGSLLLLVPFLDALRLFAGA